MRPSFAPETPILKTVARNTIKAITALGACQMAPHSSYGRMIVILSHMRGATTALSNVLCSHEQVSGYGETHVSHNRSYSPGQVVVNQYRRHAWKKQADYLFDKILHNGLDGELPETFYDAKAIFMVRAPRPSISSIVKLSAETGMKNVNTPEKAAMYYLSRLERLMEHWERFNPQHRLGLHSEQLLSCPDAEVSRVGQWLGLNPALRNAYVSHPATQAHGGGDPTLSSKLTRIEARREDADLRPVDGVPEALSDACLRAYRTLTGRFNPLRDAN
jgi:Sulfotransferase family